MGRLRQSMSSLHTWSGLLLGWLLYVMFFCGTIAYFQEEVTRWMQPEVAPARDARQAIAGAQRWLERNEPDAKSWFINLPSKRAAVTQLYFEPAKAGGRSSATLDGDGRKVSARETAGGFFLYRMHYDLHYLPVIWARYLVGVAAMFMLVAILSGVVTHKKIFADFFLLRFGKGQRSWLDAHNVTAVLALPFHLMITYTGLVSLASLYAPAPMVAAFGSEDAYYAAAFPQDAAGEPSGVRAPLTSIAAMTAQATAAFGGRDIGYVAVQSPGDCTATVAFTSSPAAGFDTRGDTVIFDGVTGQLRRRATPHGAAQTTESVVIGLHAGRYAGWSLRWLYFVSGLFGTAMVATGLVLWTAKRRQRLRDSARPHLGFRFVERLNIATIVGLPLGVAGYFLANRLLPAGLAERPDREIGALFALWGVAVLWALARGRRAWRELAWATALAFAAIPIVGALTVGASWTLATRNGSAIYPVFDMVMLATALAALAAARGFTRRAVA